MKKISILLCSILCLGLFSSCSKEKERDPNIPVVLASNFVIYDMVKNISGDKIYVDLYTEDKELSNYDLFLNLGPEYDYKLSSDLFVSENAINISSGVIPNVINSSFNKIYFGKEIVGDNGGVIGMGEVEDNTFIDLNIWLDIENDKILLSNILNVLTEKYPLYSEVFISNSNFYNGRLDEIFNKYFTLLNGKEIFIADKFYINSLISQFNISYCSLYDFDDNVTEEYDMKKRTTDFYDYFGYHNGKAVVREVSSNDEYYLELKSKRITIITLNSMLEVTEKDIADGANFLGIMENNLESLNK